jgi:hypothetical protein
MSSAIQISAFISASTKRRLERYTEAHGYKKGAVIEAALLHHLRALDELPADVIVPARVVVGQATFDSLEASVATPPEPTEALRDLLTGRQVDGLDD